MSRFKELNSRVVKWASVKGILEKGTPMAQHSKTKEEVSELGESLLAQENGLHTYYNSKGEHCHTANQILDDIGDSLVTLLIQAKMQGLDPLDCLETAVNIIELRSGEMKGGTFVKDK